MPESCYLPTFRLLLRTVIAGFLEKAQEAYEKLIWRFGDKVEEAARFLWENRNNPVFNIIGGEEVSKDAVKYIIGLVSRGGEAPTMPKIMAFLYYADKGRYVPEDLDITKTNTLKNTFRQMSTQIKTKLINKFKTKPVTEDDLYNEFNIALKEANYMSILNNKDFFGKKEAPGLTKSDKSDLLRITRPAPYRGTQEAEKAYSKFASKYQKVVMDYIDSFEEDLFERLV